MSYTIFPGSLHFDICTILITKYLSFSPLSYPLCQHFMLMLWNSFPFLSLWWNKLDFKIKIPVHSSTLLACLIQLSPQKSLVFSLLCPDGFPESPLHPDVSASSKGEKYGKIWKQNQQEENERLVWETETMALGLFFSLATILALILSTVTASFKLICKSLRLFCQEGAL